MLLKPAAAQAVSEVSKKSHPAHPTFLFFLVFFLDDVFDSDYAITRGVEFWVSYRRSRETSGSSIVFHDKTLVSKSRRSIPLPDLYTSDC